MIVYWGYKYGVLDDAFSETSDNIIMDFILEL